MTISYRSWAFVAVLLCLSAGCSSEAGTEVTGDDAFYLPPDPLPSDVPGTLIQAQEIEPFAEGSKAWRVLYVSTAVDGSAHRGVRHGRRPWGLGTRSRL